MNYGTDASGDAATDQCGTIKRHIFPNFGDSVFVDQHVFRERREVQELSDRRSFLGEPGTLAAFTL